MIQQPLSTDKPSTFQYIKWLLTCGMTSYQQNSATHEESQAFRDEDEMDELAAVAVDTDTGMVEVSLSDSPSPSAPVSTASDGEHDLFSLILATKSKRGEN
ncbi:uncharacterized protein LOC124113080 [Haliotis rufescens]|uniref:uncharacterized protein LOC124113080 n=1 Tax=Haliotis rufescens TaxID=6454 RepID=UPI00201F54B4|nr:uncharacterized protein LOC124113080 [Haliotis rufescens]